MYIAKMTTKYPDFKGEGYYNFFMDANEGWLEVTIERNLHDFNLEEIKKTRFKSVEAIIAKYPTKEELNEGLFS